MISTIYMKCVYVLSDGVVVYAIQYCVCKVLEYINNIIHLIHPNCAHIQPQKLALTRTCIVPHSRCNPASCLFVYRMKIDSAWTL